MLTDRREEILAKCREKIVAVMGSQTSSHVLERGLPTLYDQLKEVSRIAKISDTPSQRELTVAANIQRSVNRQHAQESYRLGYTVTQLVQGYGCVCQGITEFAHESGEAIFPREFSQLNLSLDVAIAQAVNEFQNLSLASAERADSLRLGFLVHELRNYLASAMMAGELIRMGGVGASGATSTILTNSHQHMREIIDRAMAEVRLHSEPTVDLQPLQIFGLLNEVEASALPEANQRGVALHVSADSRLEILADRHLMASAIANLVQNAIKFTAWGSDVWISAVQEGDEAVVEIEDRGPGMGEETMESLFTPYSKVGANQSGLGLGLSIARRAVELNGGILSARNNEDTGCTFTVRLPVWAAEGCELETTSFVA